MQDLFDKVVNHLLTQKVRSEGENPFPGGGRSKKICLYRGPGGVKCAAGALISDRYYSRELEFKQVSSSAILTAISASIGRTMSAQEGVLLSDLQYVHDSVDPSKWGTKLRDIAEYFGLKFNYVKK